MLLRIVAKSVLIGRTYSLLSRNTRHNHLSRISSVLLKSHFPRNISSENYEEIDSEFYHIHQLANKYIANESSPKDELLKKIEKFEDIQEVIQCIEDNVDKFEKIHNIQLLIQTGKLRRAKELTIIKNINDFAKKIDTQVHEMNDVELGIALLHLRLLGFYSRHQVMQNIINRILDSLNQKKENIDSMALSLFTETMCLERDLYSKIMMVETLPVINLKLQKCSDPLEFYHLISCLNSVHPVLSTDALDEYKAKIEECLQNIITSDHVRIIFKTINFLNFPHWSDSNAKIIQKLLLILQNAVPTMQSKDLLQTNRAIYLNYEPSTLIPLLRDRAKKLLEETKDVELLQIACLYCTPQERIKFVEMLRDNVLKYQATLGPGSDQLATFFKILRLLKISDTELCDCFWTKIVNKIFSLPEPDLRHRIPKYFQRYMNFNNNLGGTFRHLEFEKIVYEYCVEEMKTGALFIPKEFSKFASFTIAYSDRYETIPPFVIEKLIMMQEQLNIIDCKLISRGLEILNGFRPRRHSHKTVLDNQIEILQYILDDCAQRHLENKNLSIKDVNLILSSYVRRRAPRDSQLFFEIMRWYEGKKLELNSRIIREICHSLQVAKFCHDSVCDQFFDYILENKDIVTGETVEKILTTCYTLSYFPDNFEALECCNEIINRDFNVMTGLSVVQSLLALSFYKVAPYELISLVFNSDFIKRLEQEVQMAYSKDTYPHRVMQLVMQLNRAVCLDHPEYNIRWFQQNFIEAQMSKKPVIRNKFHDEVQRLLLHIVPGQDYLSVNKVTPYGYRIDFEIHIDKDYNKFLKSNPDDYAGINFSPNVHKIAILLLSFDTFCINDVNRLRGSELLRMRHLEMLNYKVIHVKKSDLKMMYENVTAKIKYLKKLLQISG